MLCRKEIYTEKDKHACKHPKSFCLEKNHSTNQTQEGVHQTKWQDRANCASFIWKLRQPNYTYCNYKPRKERLVAFHCQFNHSIVSGRVRLVLRYRTVTRRPCAFILAMVLKKKNQSHDRWTLVCVSVKTINITVPMTLFIFLPFREPKSLYS